MRLGAAEPLHVDVLAGHAAHDIGAGDEDPALVGQDHQVGQGRAVGRAAGRGAEHDRDLRHLAGGPGHGGEHQADGVQALDALAQPGAAGMPEAEAPARRSPAPGRTPSTIAAQPALPIAPPWHPRVAGERHGGHAVDQALAGQHAARCPRAAAAAPSPGRRGPRAGPSGRGRAGPGRRRPPRPAGAGRQHRGSRLSTMVTSGSLPAIGASSLRLPVKTTATLCAAESERVVDDRHRLRAARVQVGRLDRDLDAEVVLRVVQVDRRRRGPVDAAP